MGSGSPSGAGALASCIRKAGRRLLPFLLLLYVLAFLDRANLGFAKQSLMASTGLSEAAYAFGAGLFFAGYALLEVPSNLCLHRLGARVWMARIMVSWGLVSAAMMFAWSTPMFWTLRFLLGVAEAGFFPGVILYLTYWFPTAARARMLGWFYLGAPLALMLGGPVSGLLVEWEGRLGLHGWQWMFLVEGLAATVVGVWTYGYLPSRPGEATWLTRAEREALERTLEEEQEVRKSRSPADLWIALRDPRVLRLAMLYLLIQMSVYGVTFYLPAQVERLLGRPAGWMVGLVSAVPWACALVAAWAVPRRACRTKHPQRLAALVLLAAAGGIALSVSSSPVAALLGLSLAAAGFIGVQPVFWTFPTGSLAGVAAAGGIAWINSFGAAGGFLAPNVRVWASDRMGAPEAGGYALACTTAVAAILFLCLQPPAPPGTEARP